MSETSPSQITQRDLARKLGVSNATVSMALRGDPRICDETRDRVLNLARELDYHPNAMAAALAHQRRHSQAPQIKAAIAWLNCWPHPGRLRSYSEFDGYWRGAEAAALQFGYHLEEFVWDGATSLRRLESILEARGIDAILLPPQPGGTRLEGLNWDKFSIVRFGRSLSDPAAHVVTADQLSNTITMVEEALKLGYRRIGYVAWRAHDRTVFFDAGFFMAQRLIPLEDRVPMLEFNHEEGDYRPLLREWLETYRPEAILTDLSTIRADLRACGYEVPRDIGLAVGNVRDCDADTGIDQNPGEIGRVALLVAVSLIHEHTRGIPSIFRQILVEGSWVQGTSLPSKLVNAPS